MRWIVLFVLCVFVPDRDLGQAPFLVGPTIWGELSRFGDAIDFRGHEQWSGTGEIKETKVLIIWTRLSDGRPCPGVYEIGKDGIMRGRWGESCTVDAMWRLEGTTYADVVVRPQGFRDNAER
jgi:hypothetical protein